MTKEEFLKSKKVAEPDKILMARLEEIVEQVECKLYNQDWKESPLYKEIKEFLKDVCKKYGFKNVPVSLTEQLAKDNNLSLHRLRTQTLPEIFAELGITKITTKSGKTIQIESETSVKVLDEELFYQFLESNGYENDIKYTYAFGKSEDISKLKAFLKKEGYSCTPTKGVHYKTRVKDIKLLAKEKIFPPADTAEVVKFEIAKIK